MPADSVDAVVTDPPAGIAFMSKHWDRDKGGRTQWVAWMTEVMQECYRVLKPGGYAVVWSLPRTCHWTAWAMEDAGFIIRDQLAHVFASGFPKGRAQLKPAREDWWLARKPGPLRPLNIEECRITGEPRTTHADGNRRTSTTPGWGMAPGERDTPSGRWPSNLLLQDPELFDSANPWVVGSGATATTGGDVLTDRQGGYGGAWSGVGPRFESYGDSGGYSRFFIIPKADRQERERGFTGRGIARVSRRDAMGDVLDGATQSARLNHHPTVKPTDLMRHLVRLVTPPGGTVLDPFLGSGTTAIACELEGFPWIGIEKEPEYVAIAEARLNGTQRGLGLDVPAPTKRRSIPTDEKLAELGKTYPRRGWMPDLPRGKPAEPGEKAIPLYKNAKITMSEDRRRIEKIEPLDDSEPAA